MSSPWIQHCKAFQKEHGCSYKEAMQCARHTYNPQQMEGGKLGFKQAKHALKSAKKQGKNIQHTLDRNSELLNYIDPSLGDAASRASRTLGEVDHLTGGKLGLKKALKSAKKQGKNIQHTLDRNSELLNYIDPSLGDAASRASRTLGEVDHLTGGRLNMHHLGRQIKHTGQKVKKESKAIKRGLDQAAPLLGLINPELGASAMAISQGIGQANRLTGGSFLAHGQQRYGGSFMTPGERRYGSGRKKMVPGYTESSLIHPEHPASNPVKVKSFARSIYEN